MLRHSIHAALLVIGGLAVCALPSRADLNQEYERATITVAKKLHPSVVQINTQGGAEMVVSGPKGPAFRKAMGPTTGVVVSPDGYIISSAYNFVNNPTTILVEVPGRKDKYLAKKIATDKSRMLTLLKVDAKDLSVPAYAPKKDIFVGQWSIALGRTLDTNQDNPPSVSVGIVSALGRIWGKCLQTDARTSPVNYGGPLADIQGRVQAIVIPASPTGTGETAGFEWYDSGIGFAVPMEDVMNEVVPRLKKGKDVDRGLLGVQMSSPDIYGAKPVIGSVVAGTAAAKAGLKSGDQIIEIDGKPVERMAQVQHILGPKYEGDKIALKYKRGDQVIAIKELELVAKLTAMGNSYLGILPVRDDPKLGVEVRHVFPGSPADKAGIKAGDRIVKFGRGKATQPFKGKDFGRDELKTFVNGVPPGEEIQLEVKGKDDKAKTVTVKLIDFPGAALEDKDAPPKQLPELASRKKALESPEPGPGQPKPAKKEVKRDKVETGQHKRTTSSGNHKYWIFVHEDYDPNVAHAMLVWLHPPGKNGEKDIDQLAIAWEEHLAKHNILLVAPITDSENGWSPADAPTVQEVIRDVMAKFTVDDRRVVTHGLGVGGQMAIHMGFSARDLVNGVATTGAVPTGLKDNVASRPLQFYIVAGDRDPLTKAIAESRAKLVGRKLPVIYREIQGLGRQYLDEATLAELARWIDALDRM